MQCDGINEVMVRYTREKSGKIEKAGLPGITTSLTTLLDPYTAYTVHISYKNNANFTSMADVLHLNRTLPARE